jgi:hypothetical protein
MIKIIQKKHFCRFCLICFILIVHFNSLFAQTELPDSLVRERIQYIQTTLNSNRSNAKLWWYGWLVGYSAATIGQGIIYYSTKDKSLKQDMALGAATTFLGVAGQLITPMGPGFKANGLTLLPDNTSGERQTKLTYAEELLKSCADREIDGRSWQTHAICGVVNLGGGVITWIGFKRTVWAGLGNFALNTIITEAQIWSQPTRSIRDYKEYNRKYKYGTTSYYLKYNLKWCVNIYLGSLIVKISF